MSVIGTGGKYRGKELEALKRMIGSKIVDAGFVEGLEGGMAFDYTGDDGVLMRVVFGYTELGEWVYYQGPADRCGKDKEHILDRWWETQP